MALRVIGSGFGRTGTKSLKDALELLGLGPCHHMTEVFENPEQVPHWQALATFRPVDWDAAFAGYRAQIDWPGAHAWRALAAHYPDAKVIHSVRPEAAWWDSFSGTIGAILDRPPPADAPLPPHVWAMGAAISAMIGEQTFGGRHGEREAALAAYRRRQAEVVAAIPAERLLVYDVAEGWGPLCAFLEVAVPDAPFPRTNDRAEFWARAGGQPE
jgi:hypothetical protein